jgi:hypothetical protein
VTNGFDIQTPSAVHDGTTALSSDYTRADGTVFTGEKGASQLALLLVSHLGMKAASICVSNVNWHVTLPVNSVGRGCLLKDML